MIDVKNMTTEQKRDLFRSVATNPQARAEFAASRANVINPLLNYQSTVRYIFTPEDIGTGTPVYDIPFEDVEVTYTMPKIGGIPSAQLEGAQITVGTFGIEGGVEYQMDVATDGRFRVAELSTQLLASRFLRQEELAGWNLIKTHAAAVPSNQTVQARNDDGTLATPGSGKLNIPTLNSVVTTADQLGIGGRKVTDLYVSPQRFGDLRTVISSGLLIPNELKMALWSNTAQKDQGRGPDVVGPTVVPGLEIRVHRVYNKDLVTDNTGYAFTQLEGYSYGVMPIREPVKTRDNPFSVLEWKIGTIGRERLGFGVLDDKGLVVVTF
jgi:hypothetical protein